MKSKLNKPVVDDSELEVLIDLNEIPDDVGRITNEYFRKHLTVFNIKKLLEWVNRKIENPEPQSVCITGPMSNMVAVQLGAFLAQKVDGDIYYKPESGQRSKLILGGAAK